MTHRERAAKAMKTGVTWAVCEANLVEEFAQVERETLDRVIQALSALSAGAEIAKAIDVLRSIQVTQESGASPRGGNVDSPDGGEGVVTDCATPFSTASKVTLGDAFFKPVVAATPRAVQVTGVLIEQHRPGAPVEISLDVNGTWRKVFSETVNHGCLSHCVWLQGLLQGKEVPAPTQTVSQDTHLLRKVDVLDELRLLVSYYTEEEPRPECAEAARTALAAVQRIKDWKAPTDDKATWYAIAVERLKRIRELEAAQAPAGPLLAAIERAVIESRCLDHKESDCVLGVIRRIFTKETRSELQPEYQRMVDIANRAAYRAEAGRNICEFGWDHRPAKETRPDSAKGDTDGRD